MTTQTTNGELSTRAARRAAASGATAGGDRLPVPTRQRRPLLALLALVLILGGAAIAASLVLTSGKKQEFLVVSHDVALGQTLSAADFKQQALAATNSTLFAPVPVADFYTRVQGKKALIALKKGSLLAEGSFGDALTPAKGLVQISLNVPEGQYPRTLAAGDVVKVLYTPRGNGQGQSSGSASSAATTDPKAVPHAPTLITSAFVTSVEPSAAGQNAMVVGIEVRNKDLTQAPADGLPAVAAANALNSITIARLDPGHTYDKGGDG
jgi:flagellar hook-length control protein FliK